MRLNQFYVRVKLINDKLIIDPIIAVYGEAFQESLRNGRQMTVFIIAELEVGN